MTLATVAAVGGVPAEYVKSARAWAAAGGGFGCASSFRLGPSIATLTRLSSFFAAWTSVLAGEMAGINSGLGSLQDSSASGSSR